MCVLQTDAGDLERDDVFCLEQNGAALLDNPVCCRRRFGAVWRLQSAHGLEDVGIALTARFEWGKCVEDSAVFCSKGCGDGHILSDKLLEQVEKAIAQFRRWGFGGDSRRAFWCRCSSCRGDFQWVVPCRLDWRFRGCHTVFICSENVTWLS